jgi:hypothetical protein
MPYYRVEIIDTEGVSHWFEGEISPEQVYELKSILKVGDQKPSTILLQAERAGLRLMTGV